MRLQERSHLDRPNPWVTYFPKKSVGLDADQAESLFVLLVVSPWIYIGQ